MTEHLRGMRNGIRLTSEVATMVADGLRRRPRKVRDDSVPGLLAQAETLGMLACFEALAAALADVKLTDEMSEGEARIEIARAISTAAHLRRES